MTVDNNETPQNGAQAQPGDASAGTEGTSTQTPTEKQQWYLKRQMEKIKKEQDAKMSALEQDFSQGRIQPTPEQIAAAEAEEAAEVTSKTRVVEAENFVLKNGAYASHAERIQSMAAEQKYATLSIQEIANIAAGQSLMEQNKEQQDAARHDTGTGASAREVHNKTIDFKSMSNDEFDKFTNGVINRRSN